LWYLGADKVVNFDCCDKSEIGAVIAVTWFTCNLQYIDLEKHLCTAVNPDSIVSLAYIIQFRFLLNV